MPESAKIDDCRFCHRALPWEWVPTVVSAGRALAGTGVWRSQLWDGRCPPCLAASEVKRQKEGREQAVRMDLLRLLGGEKPLREFTFERYEVTPGNRRGFERAKSFDPSTDSLYLWGPCGVGKTHLACASARQCFEETISVEILRPWELSRRVRLKEPEAEQAAIDELVAVEALVLDDLGAGSDTPYSRQLLLEILDGRSFQDRNGLLITSKYSLDGLARKLDDDTIPSRLAGLCRVVEITGADRRLRLPCSP